MMQVSRPALGRLDRSNLALAPRHSSRALVSRTQLPRLWTARPLAPTQLRAAIPVPGFVQRELAVQSSNLDSAVLRKVEDAVEKLGYRVTVGDVAATAGVKIEEADTALQALAFDSLGALEVSAQGDVVYVFARNFKSAVTSKSLRLRARPALEAVKNASSYLLRVAFGTSLIASVVVVWVAITALLSAKSDDNRNDNRGRGGGGGYYQGGGGGYGQARMFMNISDIMYYWNPRYYRASQEKLQSGQQLNFVESIFSFVFGDGDPNTEYDAERWTNLGQMIRTKGGVVTAEEMAPFLDAPASVADPSSTSNDEAYVLPALLKFGGEPNVDSRGNLTYTFPSLQRSAAKGSVSQEAFDVPMEKEWEFTAADAGQKFGTIALGVANVVGVIVLSNLLADPQARYVAVRNGLGWTMSALPWLQVYAGAFFAIPAIRWWQNEARNKAIEARNGVRAACARLLNLGGGARLQQKIASARAQGKRRVLDQDDAVYTTAEPTAGSKALPDTGLSDWDARFERERGPKTEKKPFGVRR